MHNVKYSVSFKVILLFIVSVLTSCFNEKKYKNNVRDNFESLWTTINERYCYLEVKNINWDSVYIDYSSRLDDNMPRESFFYLMAEMLDILKDGHVSLASAFDIASYDEWYKNYPRNFYLDIIEDHYLKNYKTASGLKYQILDDNIGYVYYNSFSNGIGEGNLNEVIKHFITCDGIIIDVRNNTGGLLTNSDKLSSPFITEKLQVGFIMHKTGKGHNDFSSPYPIYIEPFKGLSYFKKVAILTNRKCFSAANDFVNSMRYIPTVKSFGDRTGGGGGLPFSSDMPNGWGIRFSASPMLDMDYQHLEFGINPDVFVEMTEADRENGIDPIIETARLWINE